jgi:hypothetical protein
LLKSKDKIGHFQTGTDIKATPILDIMPKEDTGEEQN